MKLVCYFMILLLCCSTPGHGQAGNPSPIPDVSGTWEGKLGEGIFSRIYLKKISDSVYVGIHHLNSVRPGEPLHFDTLSSLPWNFNLLFVATYDGNLMKFTMVDTTMTPPRTFDLNGGSFHFYGDVLDDLTDEKNGRLPYRAQRISTDIPPKFAKHLLNPADLQLTIGRWRPAMNDEAGEVHFVISNSSHAHYRNLQVDMFALEKDNTGTEHYVDNYWMQQFDDVDKLTHGDFAMRLGSGFPLTQDSVHFRLRISCGGVVMTEKDVKISTKAIGKMASNKGSDKTSPDKIVSTKVLDKASSGKLPGLYKLPAAVRSGKFAYFFPNEWVEFHSQGVGICRGGKGGKIATPRFFFWQADGDSLRLYELGKNATAYAFKWTGNELNIQCQSAGQPAEFVLQKVSDNTVLHYKNYLSPDTKHNWERAAIFQDGVMRADKGWFFDIHMTNESRGELIAYTDPNNMDSIFFLRYFAIANETHPAFADNDHYYSCNWLNTGPHADIDFYSADDLVIMNEFGHKTYYLLPAGPTRWNDPAALHKQYNEHYGKFVISPYGTHWEDCERCNGRGEFKSGTESVFDYKDYNGDKHYKEVDVIVTCGLCRGNGGFYVQDSDGKRLEW